MSPVEGACLHADFDAFGEVWPYFLGDNFGDGCLAVVHSSELATFDEADCLRVALRLRIPILMNGTLPVAVDVSAANPIAGSAFRFYRIQTVRNSLQDEEPCPFTADDDPFDPKFGLPYFALYGVGEGGPKEHIANRESYAEVVGLAQRLAPGVGFEG